VRGTTTLRMSWNTQGQLVSVTTNNVLAESYAYDPLGRRVKTTAGGATVYHVYQGDECAADLDSSGNPLRSYTFGQGIDNLLAVTVYSPSATNTYYAVKDHLGNVQALVNASGSVVESYTYDAWGNTTILSSDLSPLTSSQYGNRYMFQGREYSTVTGLYNFRARWYAPTLGRWLSKDPIGLEGGLNLYVFCGNCPVMFRDPWSLDIAIIHNGPTKGNPIGHVAVAITGNGVWSYANDTKEGSSLTSYLNRELNRRNTKVFVIKTTSEEDMNVLKAVKASMKKPYSMFRHNCATVVNHALDAIGVSSPCDNAMSISGDAPPVYYGFDPSATALRAMNAKDVQKYDVPMNTSISEATLDALGQFEEKQ
jgi:RHS repeat-associated protein